MSTPIDPAAVEAELTEIETDINVTFGRRPDSMPTQRRLIATCRALLAELALSQKRIEVAERSLQSGGYTYQDGAAAWKPPLGKPPDFAAVDKARAAVEVAEAADKLRQLENQPMSSVELVLVGYRRQHRNAVNVHDTALARYRAAKAGAGKLEQEQR